MLKVINIQDFGIDFIDVNVEDKFLIFVYFFDTVNGVDQVANEQGKLLGFLKQEDAIEYIKNEINKFDFLTKKNNIEKHLNDPWIIEEIHSFDLNYPEKLFSSSKCTCINNFDLLTAFDLIWDMGCSIKCYEILDIQRRDLEVPTKLAILTDVLLTDSDRVSQFVEDNKMELLFLYKKTIMILKNLITTMN